MKMKITIEHAVLFIAFLFLAVSSNSQSSSEYIIDAHRQLISDKRIIEIRSYNLKAGERNEFHKLLLEQALSLLEKWKVHVVTCGPSLHDSDSYFLARSYKDLEHMKQSEGAFYVSDDWKEGLRQTLLALILNYTTIVLPANAADHLSNKIINMETTTIEKTDSAQLSVLNAQFIKNFTNGDVRSHNEIIYKNFVCIESIGSVVDRETYMNDWATDFANSGYTSFSYGDEKIRVFGNTALVRATTTYTKTVDGKNITGHSVYTDTYIKENGRWWCVQAQITPVRNK